MWVEMNDETGSQAVMVTFYPQFMSQEIITNEFIFLLGNIFLIPLSNNNFLKQTIPFFKFLDLSSSMKGQPLEDAKRHLFIALNHLPPGSTFHLITFGSRFERMNLGT